MRLYKTVATVCTSQGFRKEFVSVFDVYASNKEEALDLAFDFVNQSIHDMRAENVLRFRLEVFEMPEPQKGVSYYDREVCEGRLRSFAGCFSDQEAPKQPAGMFFLGGTPAGRKGRTKPTKLIKLEEAARDYDCDF